MRSGGIPVRRFWHVLVVYAQIEPPSLPPAPSVSADEPGGFGTLGITYTLPPMSSAVVGSISHSSATEVLSARPVLTLLATLKAKHEEYTRLSPNSDAGPTMAWVADLLASAVAEGRTGAVRLSIVDAARLYGRPLSSVRWACKRHGTDIGAVKASGAWTVDRAKFSAYCSTLKARSAA